MARIKRKMYSRPLDASGKPIFSGWGKLNKGTRAIAKRAERKVKEINRTREIKYHNYSNSNNVSNSGAIECITEIPQGDGAQTRDGLQVSLRSIKMTASFSLDSDAPGNFRLIIFQDKQQVAGSAPTVSDVLLSANPLSNYNYPQTTKRFKILYDKLLSLHPLTYFDGTGSENVPAVKNIRKYIYPTMKNAKWNDAAGNTYQKNMVYALFISDVSLSPPAQDLTLNCQVSFNDS